MSDTPKTGQEFTERFVANQHISGHGLTGTTMHLPCPFCAAPDFMVFLVVNTEEELQEEHACSECKRSGRNIITISATQKAIEFVQTDGPPPPAYLTPAPRMYPKPLYG